MKNTLLSTIITLSFILSQAGAQAQIRPGQVWNDTKGEAINAHGSCVVENDGTYYWFGECRKGSVTQGISCYKSTDLYHWENLGLALPMQGTKAPGDNDIAPGRLFERPKVIYNKKTGKWVMWIHWENGKGYGEARVCVATADKVSGPYTFYKTFRPNTHESRDQTLFLDNDGKAYHICSTDMNTNTNIALLRPDFLEPTKTETKILLGEKCEAASLFRVGNRYFGLFSGCTGWTPNPGRYAYADNILGEWHYDGANFAVDAGRNRTYQSQSAYVFKVGGDEKKLVYIGDRWNSGNVGASLQVWLPISMRSGYPAVRWYEQWDLTVFDKMYRYKRAAEIKDGNVYALLEKRSDRLMSKPQNKGLTLENDDDALNLSLNIIKVSDGIYKIKDTKTGKYLCSVFGTLRFAASADEESALRWKFTPQPDGYYTIENMKDKKFLSVSGAGTEAGTGVYLTAKSKTIPQDFAVYFDSDKYNYKEAAIFQ